MTVGELEQRFHLKEVDQTELEQLLFVHFGLGKGITPREIRYFHTGSEQPALILRYNANSEVESLEAGPGLTDADLVAIEQKVNCFLLTSTGTIIGQTVLFAHVPTTKHFRYRDRFQILQVPPHAPRPPAIIGEHPLLLEYAFEGSADMQINGRRRQQVSREIELLVVALTTTIWKGIPTMMEFHWVLTNASDLANWRTEYLQGMYYYEGMGATVTAFSTPNGESVGTLPSADYYSRPGVSGEQVLDLPDNFVELLDRFYALQRDERDRFLRACFWFQHARKVYTMSRSASFTAMVSTIESLSRPAIENDGSKCPKCGKDTGPGPTRRFIDFVEKFAPEPAVSRQARRDLYGLRSALSHGGSLLHSDRDGWMSPMTAEAVEEWEDRDTLWRIVRVALVNWLYAQGRSA